MCLLVLGGDPAAWRVSGGHGSIPQCPGEACRELNGSENARSRCPFVKDKSFKSHRPIRLTFDSSTTGDVYKHFAGGISGVLRADVEAKILTEIETEFLDDDDDGGGGGGEDEALEEAWRALNAIWRASLPPSVRYPASSALGA